MNKLKGEIDMEESISIDYIIRTCGLSERQIKDVIGDALITEDAMSKLMQHYPKHKGIFWVNATKGIFEAHIDIYILECTNDYLRMRNAGDSGEYSTCECGQVVDGSGCSTCAIPYISLEDVFLLSPDHFESKEDYREYCTEGARALREAEAYERFYNTEVDRTLPSNARLFDFDEFIEELQYTKFFAYSSISFYYDELLPLHDYILAKEHKIMLTSYGMAKINYIFSCLDI
jgi:hypothetical protein